MDQHLSTTPFGRRSLTLAHVASQAMAKARPPDKAVHKWQVFRAICTAKARIGVSERALAVLDALLSFHPETTLSGEGLIVFPSNQQLALRAHGMALATLRRHLSALVDCGLVIRRDSPNGKRFARKGRGGTVEKRSVSNSAPWWRGPRSLRPGPRTCRRRSGRCDWSASASRSAGATSPR